MSLSADITAHYRRFPAAFWRLWAMVVVNRAGAFVFPFLMLFMTTRRAMSVEAAGSALSVYGAGAVGAAVLGGQLADRWGRRATLLLSFFGGAVAVCVLGLVSGSAALVAAVFLFGLFGELYRPALSASVSDLVAPEDHRVAFGHLYWAYNLGFAIAPATAGLVTARYGFRVAFAINIVALLTCALWTLRTMTESRPAHAAADGGGFGRQLAVLRDPRLRLFLLAFAPVPLLLLQTVSVLPVLLREDHLDTAALGQILSCNGVFIVLLQPWLITRFSTLPRTSVLAFGALCLGAGFAGHALADTKLQHLLALCLWTFGEIATVPMAAGIIAELAPLEQRGRYQGAYGLTWSFAHLSGPTVAAFAFARGGMHGWAIGCACAGLVSATLYVVFGAREAKLRV